MTSTTLALLPVPAALQTSLAFLVVLCLGSCVSAPQPLPEIDSMDSVDFSPLARFSEAYRVMRYQPAGQVRAANRARLIGLS